MINNLSELRPYANDINWELDPATAVTLYLEWGNNNWHAEHPPVRSTTDIALYFVLDCWENPPCVRLVQRNSERAEDIATLAIPQSMLTEIQNEYGSLHGIFEPPASLKKWLRQGLGLE